MAAYQDVRHASWSCPRIEDINTGLLKLHLHLPAPRMQPDNEPPDANARMPQHLSTQALQVRGDIAEFALL